MEWYYTTNGQQQGPVTQEQLQGMIQSGAITQETMVWREGMADWQPLSAAQPELLGGAAPVANKDFNVQAMREGVHGDIHGAQMQYAGFWIRFAAKLLDGIVLWIVLVPIQIVIFPIAGMTDTSAEPTVAMTFLLGYMAFSIMLPVLYHGFMVGKYGATLGKMACGLKVVRPDGSEVSMGLGFGRALSEIISGIIFYIGYIIAAFDDEKRALHDRIASTRVIKNNR